MYCTNNNKHHVGVCSKIHYIYSDILNSYMLMLNDNSRRFPQVWNFSLDSISRSSDFVKLKLIDTLSKELGPIKEYISIPKDFLQCWRCGLNSPIPCCGPPYCVYCNACNIQEKHALEFCDRLHENKPNEQ